MKISEYITALITGVMATLIILDKFQVWIAVVGLGIVITTSFFENKLDKKKEVETNATN